MFPSHDPMEAPDTELVSEDTSLDLQDSKSFDFEKIQASLFPKTIDGQPAPRLQQEKFAIEDIERNRKIKAEYYTDQQEDLASNVSQKKIISEEAIDIFGPIEPRDAKTPKVSSVVTPGVSPTVYLAPKFNSDKEYDDYLKNTLGNDYNSYLNYLKTGEIDVSTKETRLNARKKVVQRQAELFTIANDIPEEVQKYMMFEPEFATGNSKEEQEFAIDLIKKNYDDTYKNYLSNIDKWKKEAVPLSKEIDKIQTQLKDFEYDKNNQPIITNQEELDKYNLLATQNNNILQQWEKQGFNVLYNNLIKQEEVLEIEQDNYIYLTLLG